MKRKGKGKEKVRKGKERNERKGEEKVRKGKEGNVE